MCKRLPIDTFCEKKISTLQKTYNGLIDYVDISSVDNAEKRIVSFQTIEAQNAPSRAKQLLNNGDIIVSTVRPNLNAVAIVEEETDNLMVGSTGYCVLRCKDTMDARYLFNFCQSQYFIDDMTSQATGASYPAVSSSIVKNSLIPVCSLEEQRKIAKRIDTVSELIDLRQQQLKQLDELVKSRFIELFGEVETNDKGFVMKRMDECCKFVGGAQPDKSHFEYEKTDDNIRLIQIRDYKSDRFVTYIPKLLARKTCTASDIMIGRYGPPIFQILGGIEGAYNVALMKAMPTAEFNAEYFRYFLKSEKLLHYLESFSQRTAGQDGIQIDKLNAYPCFVPPMDLQNQFAAFVEQTDKLKYCGELEVAA